MSDIKAGDLVIIEGCQYARVLSVSFSLLMGKYAVVRYASYPHEKKTGAISLNLLRKVEFEPKLEEKSEPKKSEKGNQNSAPEFGAGDVVRLKSGGPLMTVSDMEENEVKGLKVRVVWFQESAGEYLFEDLFASSLLKIETQA